jgi:hypothetical protein
MYSEIILGLISVFALVLAVYQTVQVKGSDKKLEEAKESIKELEEGMVLSEFKLKKAVQYYEEGEYNNSLEAFKKYSVESEDYVQLEKAITKIFLSESRKIYADFVGKDIPRVVLIMIVIARGTEGVSKYPEYLNKLVEIYINSSGDSYIHIHLPLLLNQEKYPKVLEIVPESDASEPTKSLGKNIAAFIRNHCINKINST